MPVAAAPVIASVAGGALSMGSSLISASKAKKNANNVQKQIDNYQRQDLVNPYEALQVSTLGADRQREDLARSVATYGNLSAMGGTRGIMAIAPRLISQQADQEAQIAAALDQQEVQRLNAIAQGEAMVQGMTEQRENNDLLGLGNQLNTYRQEGANAMNQFVQSAFGTGLGLSGLMGGVGSTGQNTTVGSTAPYLQPLQRITMSPYNPNLNFKING